MAKILAVDDSLPLLTTLRALLEASGFEVVTCSDPKRAVTLVERNKFDLLVTDFDMPGIDGLCFAKQARAADYRGPILMSTGSDRVYGLGICWIDRLLPKSAPVGALIQEIRTLTTAGMLSELVRRDTPWAA